MSKEEIMGQVVDIIRPYVKEERALATLNETTSILEDLKVNSARLVDIVLAFEDAFDIEVEDDDADKVKTIGDATELVLTKIAA